MIETERLRLRPWRSEDRASFGALVNTPAMMAHLGGRKSAAGIDAIICGPGDIVRAHKPNEYITRDELAACATLLDRLGSDFAEGAA